MRTPITYYGGKQTLLKYILPLIPPHERYTEAFCGGCAVLFAKEPSKCEVINDLLSLISTIKGKFMLTMYPYDKILTFANEHHWHIHSVERRISSSRTTRRLQTEWIVTNY